MKDDVAEEPLMSSDDEEDVEESRRDVKHRKRQQLVKSMKTPGALIDETMKGEMVVHPKTKETLPKMSLVMTKTYDWYIAKKKSSPKRFREVYTLDNLDKLCELSLRRAEKKNIPNVKELIKLEEKSLRTPTVKDILKHKPLDTFADMRKSLSFRESDKEIALEDAPEVEPGEEEEVELGEAEEGEETET